MGPNHTKLKKLYKQQKHASRVIYNEERMTHSRLLMKSQNALNISIYELQSWPKIMAKTSKNGVVLDTTSNVKFFSETI